MNRCGAAWAQAAAKAARLAVSTFAPFAAFAALATAGTFSTGAAAASAACPLAAPALQQGAVQAAWAVASPPIAVGKHFALDIQVCPLDAVLSRVDATMPEHRHGMNYRPSLKRLGPGQWRSEGLLFHMPGRWQLRLDVQTAGSTETLLAPINLP
jgi:hypothetical protein